MSCPTLSVLLGEAHDGRYAVTRHEEIREELVRIGWTIVGTRITIAICTVGKMKWLHSPTTRIKKRFFLERYQYVMSFNRLFPRGGEDEDFAFLDPRFHRKGTPEKTSLRMWQKQKKDTEVTVSLRFVYTFTVFIHTWNDRRRSLGIVETHFPAEGRGSSVFSICKDQLFKQHSRQYLKKRNIGVVWVRVYYKETLHAWTDKV